MRGVRERPGGSEGAHASDDERRLRRVDVLPGEPEPRCTLAREVVQDDVGARRSRALVSSPSAVLRSTTTERFPRFSGMK